MTPDLKEGDRVLVFDWLVYRFDTVSAIDAHKPATIVRRYSETSKHSGYHYPDLIDVVFDHRPERISKGHFTTGVERLA